jgi:preprotein translocase subunit YajC
VGLVIIIVVAFALMWLLLIRPQRRRSDSQLAMQDRLRVGDEIITAGGLHAIVQSAAGDVLEVEIAPGTTVRLDRRAVAAVAASEEPEEPEEPALEEGSEPADENQPISSDESYSSSTSRRGQ